MGWMDNIPGASIISGVASYFGQKEANTANREISREQMRFQQDMSNTAHQRQVRDLRAAGLNPILSANAGASTPPGASAEMQNALGAGVTSALDAARLKKEIAAVDSQIGLNEAAGKAQLAAAGKDAASAKQAQAQTTALMKQMKAIEKRAKADETQADWDLDMSTYDNVFKRGKDATDVLGDVLLRRLGNKTSVPRNTTNPGGEYRGPLRRNKNPSKDYNF